MFYVLSDGLDIFGIGIKNNNSDSYNKLRCEYGK